MTLYELTAPIRRGLAELRGRVRSLILIHGTARVLLFLAAALLAYFLADYFLRLPRGVRVISLLVLLGGLGFVVYQHLVRPLAVRLGDEMLAGHVERGFPELRDRLSSSLAFTHAAEDPDNEDSPELMRHVVEETVGLSGSIRFGSVARSRPTVRWSLVAAALLAMLITTSAVWPESFGTFLRRGILLQAVDWPRRTTLVVVGMKPGVPRKVTLGRETTVKVRAKGSLPDRVRFTFWERAQGDGNAETIDLTPSAEDPALYVFTLQVQASYDFKVVGGDDDRAEIHRIEALTPPAILAVEVACKYPEYLGRPDETLTGGDQRIPQGTHARISLRTNMDLAEASITFGNEEAVPLEAAGEQVYAIAREFDEDLRYAVHLRGHNGEENDPRLDTFWIRVQNDQPPAVHISTPGLRAERLAGGVVLAAFRARDDHGVSSVRFHYRVNEGEPRVIALGESGGDAIRLIAASESSPEHVRGLAAVDLPRVLDDAGEKLIKNAEILYWFEATDSSGQAQRNRSDHRIEIVAEDQVNNDIESRQASLREGVERALVHARTAGADLEVLADTPVADPEFRRWSTRAQAAQARVIDDIEALARRVGAVVNLYVFNRLDDPSAVGQMLPYFERHLLTPSERSGLPYRGPLYRTLWTALNERAIRVGGSLGKLLEMADIADHLATDQAPDAYRVLGLARKESDDAGVAATLAEARRLQAEVEQGLDRLDQLMREWQTFESVVRFFKGLRESERTLVNELEQINSADK